MNKLSKKTCLNIKHYCFIFQHIVQIHCACYLASFQRYCRFSAKNSDPHPYIFHPNFGAFLLDYIADVGVPRSEDTKLTRKSCTGQVLPSAKYRPTRLVVDAALRRNGKSRHGGHKIAYISLNCWRIKKRISPMESAHFSGRSEG